MKEYVLDGKVIRITLDTGKQVMCSTKWAEDSMKALDTDLEDVLLMFLEDNDYLVNEEQDELDKNAKGKVKNIVTDTAKKKTQRERVVKENPTKELIIKTLADSIATLDIENLAIENKAKLITFTMNGEDFKIDLVQKRKPKK